jgi:hypothetical protein
MQLFRKPGTAWWRVFMQDKSTGCVPDYKHSMKMGIMLGFIAGLLIGFAMLAYIGSEKLNNNWPFAASIPLWNAFGWALYGMIVGGSGALSNFRISFKDRHVVVGTAGRAISGKPSA